MKVKKLIFQLQLIFLRFREKLSLLLELFLFLLSIATGFLLIWRMGVHLDLETKIQIHQIRTLLFSLFFIASSFQLVFNYRVMRFERLFFVDIAVYVLLFFVICAGTFFPEQVDSNIPIFRFLESPFLLYPLLFLLAIVNISKTVFKILGRKTNPSLLFIYSFLFLILIGTGLLLMPNAHIGDLSFTDALFTSTTSVCVTGLTSVDIASTFTYTGQIIIILLIQIGGLGVMTFTSFFALAFMGYSGFSSSFALRDFLSENNLGNMFKTLVNIIFVTLMIESIGAILIFQSIHQQLGRGLSYEIFISVFHSISAFCNAGISVFEGNLMNPLVATNYLLQCWVALLIIFGGLGFPIIFNYMKLIRHIANNWFRMLFKKQEKYKHLPKIINVHSRLVVITTLFLLVFGTLFIYFSEYSNILQGMSVEGKWVTSFFGAVTPRTAGFNNFDPGDMLPTTIVITIFLMAVGAGPMSTGGGIKVSTFALSLLSAFGIAKGKKNTEIFGREIDPFVMKRAYATVVLYFLWVMVAVFALSLTETNGNITTWAYEVISALSTVGLSLNFTPELSIIGKYIIIFSMFAGRIGILTFFAGILKQYQQKAYQYPQAQVIL